MSRSQKSFPKNERVTNKGDISKLFAEGSSFTYFPLKTIYLLQEGSPGNQIMISVPKRNFKKAVDRNLLKRRIREAHRKHKYLLGTGNGKKMLIAYIYLARELLSYKMIEEKLIDALHRLQLVETKKVEEKG